MDLASALLRGAGSIVTNAAESYNMGSEWKIRIGATTYRVPLL
jgi:hypothetical protein